MGGDEIVGVFFEDLRTLPGGSRFKDAQDNNGPHTMTAKKDFFRSFMDKPCRRIIPHLSASGGRPLILIKTYTCRGSQERHGLIEWGKPLSRILRVLLLLGGGLVILF
jgi:hypothetical protein